MKFLSIVIPHYTETERVIFPLLSSISNQLGVDWKEIEVIIANDGGAYPLGEDFLGMFEMPVRQISLDENRGPGVTRQAGIDAARGEYVMFCDADDMLFSATVLDALTGLARNGHADYIVSHWVEEVKKESGTFGYQKRSPYGIWMHGKLFLRSFLTRDHIRFDSQLRSSEDGYFITLASILAERTAELTPSVITYVWKWRDESLVRRNRDDFRRSAAFTHVKAFSKAFCELEQRGLPDSRIMGNVLQFITGWYFELHTPFWRNSADRDELEQLFARCAQPIWHYYLDAPSEAITRIYAEERQRVFEGHMEEEPFSMWLYRLGLPKRG